ncbi:hypothetical protein [Salinarimonas soli]|uniref:Uncharacterized protein n=1 Tax=Salinarimonas soli TaxID=1638099 RepID=A0A5B2VSS7_9HYPH|nr:hypothetical protein [Salinarimonas soli]KAA2241159.1 hypothetical protein F0L46_05005 [Salinarimonas soli]
MGNPSPRLVPFGEWYDLAKWLRDNDGGRLTPEERRFVNDMAQPLPMRRGRTPTPRQFNWLRTIAATLSPDRRVNNG